MGKTYEHYEGPLASIRIKVSLSTLKSLTKMVLKYVLYITSVYPHKIILLAYTYISCSYSISAFFKAYQIIPSVTPLRAGFL